MILKYCTECAAPLHQHTPTVYECDNGHPYYNNPRAACAAVLINKKGEVLFAKRAREPQKGKYDLPGGFVDYGENAWAAIRRELLEEADVIPDDLQLIDIVLNDYLTNIDSNDAIFLCRSWQGTLTAADDVMTLEWKPLAFMISDSFAWKNAYQQVYETLRDIVA